MRLRDAATIDDVRRIAEGRLPRIIYDVIEGGAGDEWTLNENRLAFSRVLLDPRPLVDLQHRDLSTEFLGRSISMPVGLAPTGAGRLLYSGAELATARAAGRHGIPYIQSSISGFDLAAVAQVTDAPTWFQLYAGPDVRAIERLVARVTEAGYDALVVTIDTPVFGNRDRDTRNRFSLPIRVNGRMIGQALKRPRWTTDFLRGNLLPRRAERSSVRPVRLSLRQVESDILRTTWPVTWDLLDLIRQLWQGPLVVKGVLQAGICDRLIELGVDGVIVSNHGGRQMDSVSASLDVLPEVVDVCAGRIEVYMDGGVRRGIDILKAVALGATGCFIGRPYLYGLAAAGEAGVSKVLDMLRSELDTVMALSGCGTIADIDRGIIRA